MERAKSLKALNEVKRLQRVRAYLSSIPMVDYALHVAAIDCVTREVDRAYDQYCKFTPHVERLAQYEILDAVNKEMQ